MKIVFDLEGAPDEAFFGVYAGLRMYKEHKDRQAPKGMFFIAAAENGVRLEELKEKYPTQYAEAEQEYNKTVAKRMAARRAAAMKRKPKDK